jgi:hypothetical protein
MVRERRNSASESRCSTLSRVGLGAGGGPSAGGAAIIIIVVAAVVVARDGNSALTTPCGLIDMVSSSSSSTSFMVQSFFFGDSCGVVGCVSKNQSIRSMRALSFSHPHPQNPTRPSLLLLFPLRLGFTHTST